MPLDYDKLAARFAATGLTLEEAGVRMGWPKATARQNMSQLIKGRRQTEAKTPPAPRLDTLELLCSVLGCGLLDLLTNESPARGPRAHRR